MYENYYYLNAFLLTVSCHHPCLSLYQRYLPLYSWPKANILSLKEPSEEKLPGWGFQGAGLWPERVEEGEEGATQSHGHPPLPAQEIKTPWPHNFRCLRTTRRVLFSWTNIVMTVNVSVDKKNFFGLLHFEVHEWNRIFLSNLCNASLMVYNVQ